MIRTIKTERHTARKNHVCYDCKGLICPGDTYERITLVDGPSMYTWLSCAICEPWRAAVEAAGWVWSGDDLMPGWLMDAIDACAYHSDTETYEVRK